MPEYSLAAAFLVGLLGGAHCVAMCGGIVGALSLHAPARAGWRLHLGYSAGRIASYTLAGLLAGALGAGGTALADWLPLRKILHAAASLLLVGLGLYLAGIWHGVTRIERAGATLWRRLQPLTAGLLPADRPARALALGALWGWLPCGLVYSVLVMALASASALGGALLLAAFGLGTLPNLLAAGLFADRLARLTRNPTLRRAAGAAVAGFGLLGLWRLAA